MTRSGTKAGADTVAECAVKSAARVLRVLEFFRDHQQPVRALVIGRALGMAASSTADLLKTLTAEGYLYFDSARKTYYPTPRVATLSRWMDDSRSYYEGLLELMRRLNREIGCATTLSYQNRDRVQFCAIVQSGYTTSINLIEGSQVPLLESAAGVAMLMGRRDEEVMVVARSAGRVRDTAYGSHCLEQVRYSRARGYAVVHGGYWADNCGIAIPLPRPPGDARAAICVGGPIGQVAGREAAIAEHMRDALRRHLPAAGSRV